MQTIPNLIQTQRPQIHSNRIVYKRLKRLFGLVQIELQILVGLKRIEKVLRIRSNEILSEGTDGNGLKCFSLIRSV